MTITVRTARGFATAEHGHPAEILRLGAGRWLVTVEGSPVAVAFSAMAAHGAVRAAVNAPHEATGHCTVWCRALTWPAARTAPATVTAEYSRAAREAARFASLLWLCAMTPAGTDVRTAAL